MVNVGFIIIFIGSLMQLIKTRIVTHNRMIIIMMTLGYKVISKSFVTAFTLHFPSR